MKEYLKKFWIIRSLARRARMFWISYKNNPDILEKIERKIFQLTQRKRSLAALTTKEMELIQNLRARIEELPMTLPNPSTPAPERGWMNVKNELRTKILTEDPRNFLKWEIVSTNMVGSLPRRDYLTLQNMPFWQNWSKKIATLSPIHQYPYFKFPHTDGTTLLHLYHLAQFKAQCDREVSEMDLIIEFGGGYGAMCATAFTLGFKGKYILFDWPEFLLLQEFYLKLRDIDTSKIKFTSILSSLKKTVEGKKEKVLLIATWSLSETSEEFRNEFLGAVNPQYYIMAYQRSFAGIDNHNYFRKFATLRPDITWKDFPMLNLPGDGNRYLFGSSA